MARESQTIQHRFALPGARVAGAIVALAFFCAQAFLHAAPQEDREEDARATLREFRSAVRAQSREALLPTLRLSEHLALVKAARQGSDPFRMEDLARLLEGVPAPQQGGKGNEDTITFLGDFSARADLAPLLKFRPSVYLVREGDAWRVDLAATLQGARRPRTKDEIIALCRAALRGIAEDVELVETEHFLVFSHTGPESTRAAVETLEQLHSDFQAVFPFDLGGPPVKKDASEKPFEVARLGGCESWMVVFLFSYRDTFRTFAARHAPGAEKTGGYATPAGYFATWFSPRFRSTVRHEGSHLLMYRRMRLFGAPNWLAEGIAETLAETLADGQDDPTSNHSLRHRLNRGERFNLEELMRRATIRFGVDYHVSHSLVHYLRREHPEAWTEFIRAVRAYREQKPEECRADLLRTLNMTQDQLEERWKAYVLSGRETPQINE